MAVTVVESARLLWCPNLTKLLRKPELSIQDWISKSSYAPSIYKGCISLQSCDVFAFAEALGTDINRVSTAGSETLKHIVGVSGMPKSLGWLYVKLYYAAYFYAHSLLRIWGRSSSFLRTLELMPLRDSFSLYGISLPFKPLTGQFMLQVDVSAAVVEICPDGGGAHETLWKQYHKAIEDLRNSIHASGFLTSDKASLDAQLGQFASLISGSGRNLAWLSQMRNNIQYRQTSGLWYPYEGKLRSEALETVVSRLFKGDLKLSTLLTQASKDLTQFEFACCAVILLSRQVLADMQTISGSKSFLQYGQRKFEDTL